MRTRSCVYGTLCRWCYERFRTESRDHRQSRKLENYYKKKADELNALAQREKNFQLAVKKATPTEKRIRSNNPCDYCKTKIKDEALCKKCGKERCFDEFVGFDVLIT